MATALNRSSAYSSFISDLSKDLVYQFALSSIDEMEQSYGHFKLHCCEFLFHDKSQRRHASVI